ncbi:hypothetical protein BN1263590037 [Stenotrophomonas indicatrix]|nr:hypothetical protein BN1263590037 [Stenotrophomonas indicatrix]
MAHAGLLRRWRAPGPKPDDPVDKSGVNVSPNAPARLQLRESWPLALPVVSNNTNIS